MISCASLCANTSNLAGVYDCTCVEVGTKEISKGVMTVKKTGQTYSTACVFDDGSHYSGTGIYLPEKKIFAISFFNPKKAAETGLVIANVKNDLSMSSQWTYLGKTTLGQGSCVKRAD